MHALKSRPWPGRVLCWVALWLLAIGLPGPVVAVDPCSAVLNPPRPRIGITCVPSGANPQQCDPAKERSRIFTSLDEAAEVTSRLWDFGDGATASGATVEHLYLADGLYLASLRLTTNEGAEGVEVAEVPIGGGPGSLAVDDQLDMGWTPPGTPTNSIVPRVIAFSELLSNDAQGVWFQTLDTALNGLTINTAQGQIEYRSAPGFSGSVSFVYSVTDGFEVDPATVTLTVGRAAPIATPDSFVIVGINRTFSFRPQQLLGNDIPSDAFFHGVQNGFNGTVAELAPDEAGRRFLFTPLHDFAGFAGFEYEISWEGAEPLATGVVTLEIQDAGPWADFSYNCVNRTCTFSGSVWDDVGFDEFLWSFGNGQTYLAPNWLDFNYTFPASGRFTVSLTVTDTAGHSSDKKLAVYPDPATAALDLPFYPPGSDQYRVPNAKDVVANTPPVATDDAAVTERDIAVTIPVLANDSDGDNDPLVVHSVTLTHPGAAFQILWNKSTYKWEILFTPPDSYVGQIGGTYMISDPLGGSDSGSFTATVNQWSSVLDALGEQFAVPFNSPWYQVAKATLMANDYDGNRDENNDGVDDGLKIVSIDSSLLMGTLDCLTDPLICVYRPPINGVGYSFFRYTLRDGAGRQDTATVRLYVGHANPAPTTTTDWFTTPNQTKKTFSIQDVTQNDVDPLGDTLTMIMSSGPRDYGSVVCTTPMYSCTYTPMTVPSVNGAGFVGPDRFLYSASDILNPPVPGYINILTLPAPAPNRAFDAREDVVTATANFQTSISYALLKSNDYDPEAQPTTITAAAIDKAGLLGTMTCDATACLYKSSSGFSGVTRFKYTATDSQGNTDTAIVKIRVGSAANAAPVVGPQEQFTTPRNVPITFSVFDLLKNDYDPDNDPLTVTVFPVSPASSRNGTMSCGTPNYWCTFTPTAVGDDVVTYTVSDGTTTTTSTFKITIN